MQDALRAAVGAAARRAGVRLRRPIPRRGHDPPAQRAGLRRRRGVLAASRVGPDQLRLKVAVGDRRYHAQHLRELTGIDVGEGQAAILLGDLHAYQAQLCREAGHDVDEPTAAQLWVMEVVRPTMAAGARGGRMPRNPDPGLLRSAGGAVAAVGASRPGRGYRAGPGGSGGRGGAQRLGGAVDGGGDPTQPFSGARRAGLTVGAELLPDLVILDDIVILWFG